MITAAQSSALTHATSVAVVAVAHVARLSRIPITDAELRAIVHNTIGAWTGSAQLAANHGATFATALATIIRTESEAAEAARRRAHDFLASHAAMLRHESQYE